jgi:hypothetical protein
LAENQKITEIQRSILPANEKIWKEAQAKFNQSGKTREEKSELLKEVFAFDAGPKIVGYDKMQTAIIDLYVRANNFWLDFFEYRTLSGSEIPKYYEKSLPVKIPINVVSNLGGYSTITYTDGMTPVTFDMDMYQSDIVKYPKYDLRQGFVDRSEEVNNRLKESVDDKLDTLAETAFGTIFGAFTANTWILDSKIKNPPTTNDFDLRASCNGKINKNLFRAIINHGARMEKGVRAVYLPSARRGDEFDWVSVSGADVAALATVPVSVAEEIWRSGQLPSGALIPPCVYTSRLEGETPDGIYVYVVYGDQPLGYFYQKPEIHYTETESVRLFFETYTAFTGAVIVPNYLKSNAARFLIG